MQEAISTSQALSDVKSNQTSINTNLSNEFGNDLRGQGYDPTQMTAPEQEAQAQKFMENSANPQYGIKNHLDSPSNNLASGNVAHPKIDTFGLARPDNVTGNHVASHKAEVQAAIDNFSNHQGHIIGNEIKEQGKTAYHTSGDIMNGIISLPKSLASAAKNAIKSE